MACDICACKSAYARIRQTLVLVLLLLSMHCALTAWFLTDMKWCFIFRISSHVSCLSEEQDMGPRGR
jgi:hypothetical protein